jgi:hypothetical protein
VEEREEQVEDEVQVDQDVVGVEWLILADSAQVVGNKLYLLGGGWDALTVNSGFPVTHPCAVAVSFRVPWSETNRPLEFEVEIQDADGQSLIKINGSTEVGRPAGVPFGTTQRSQIAVNMPLQFPRAGGYVVIARVDGGKGHRVPFYVVPGRGATTRRDDAGAA